MDWTLEVVVLPVSDIDRSVAFYRDQVGFHLDHDTQERAHARGPANAVGVREIKARANKQLIPKDHVRLSEWAGR